MEINDKNNEILLKEFNNNYKSNLDLDCTKIDVFSCNILDKGLSLLCSINFHTKIEQLLLEDNNITNITPLSHISFGENLLSLDLSSNKISSIDILSKVNFPSLNHLYLNNNSISNIDAVCNFKFPNLLELNLSSNKISSIDILIKANFPNLRELLLSKNEICSIDALSNVNFPKLKILTLNRNKINSIDSLSEIKLDKIRELKIEKNSLKSIKVLSKANFPRLSYLSLGDDMLRDNLEDLKKTNFSKLEDICVYLNEKINKKNQKITDIVNFFENKGVSFNFIKYDKNGDEIFDKDINFMHNYDDDDDDDSSKENIIHDVKSNEDYNNFLLKEGLI